MTLRREHTWFAAAAFGLWLLFFVQALISPVLLDDWFQLRYWRDHEFTPSEIWGYARHNYFHYNPRIGEVFLAIIDGSRVVHLIATPLVQLALLPTVYVIAFGRWPRRNVRDLQLLLFIQVMIWLVIPIPGMMYFYRPFTTNYVWGFTITLLLFVPYRLALANHAAPRLWLVPIMLVLGWAAGMCNEHTGPAAMVAMAVFVGVAARRRQLRAWMLAGMVGLYIGYPMLFFAPGQALRYAGQATRDTPVKLLAERGLTGCVEILFDFLWESRLAILLFIAALVRYLITFYRRGERVPRLPRIAGIGTAVLVVASGAIVVTLFVSPTASDRVFFASGVLLVAALAICAEHLFHERGVRRLMFGVCIILFAFHAGRFIETYVGVKRENDERIEILRATKRGTVAVVPAYERNVRSRWHLGDDFQLYPWLADYVGGELYDLANVDVDRRQRRPSIRYIASPPLAHVPTYREWLERPMIPTPLSIRIAGLAFEDPRRRPIFVVDANRFVDGRPYDDARGHFIRVKPSSLPERVESIHVIGCGYSQRVELVGDLLPVDERVCRGPFTAIMCEPARCWVAGWY